MIEYHPYFILQKKFMSNIVLVIIIALISFVVWKFLKKFKVPKIGSMSLISGGVKCGKSTLAVAIVLSEYKRRCRKIKFKNFFLRLFKKTELELPLIYSNIPLACPYVKLTEDLLLRKKRFVYGSVIYVCEAALVADSQLIRDMELNERLLLFNKLIGHETKGGCLIYDTQCVGDVHYSIKRSLSEYIYIHHLTKWIPFFLIAHVRECHYSDDNSTVNAFTEDLENHLRKVIIRKSTWKYFDSYCYSVLTDDLPVEKTLVNNDKKTEDLKANEILTFKKGGVLNEKKDSK